MHNNYFGRFWPKRCYSIERVRIFNQAYIYELAVSTFGSKSKANEWLNQYHQILGETPIAISESTAGLIEVERIPNAIN